MRLPAMTDTVLALSVGAEPQVHRAVASRRVETRPAPGGAQGGSTKGARLP